MSPPTPDPRPLDGLPFRNFDRSLHGRLPYLALAFGTIALGLAVHWHGDALSPAVRDVLGDALWAAMIAWWVAVVAPAARLPARSTVALAICFLVELSQLYHGPAVDALRQTIVGHLVLGSDFDPRDLGAYTLGVLAATLLDHGVSRRSPGNYTAIPRRLGPRGAARR